MIRHIGLPSVLVGLLALSPAPALAWGLPEMMAAMASVRSERAHFMEKKNLSILQEPIQTAGLLEYRSPDFLKKETVTPTSDTLEVEGDWLRIDSDQTKQRIHLPSYPMLQALVEAVRSTMAGDLPRLEQFYSVHFHGNESRWVLELEPLISEVRDRLVRTIIAGHGNRIDFIRTEEKDGDSSEMTVDGWDIQ